MSEHNKAAAVRLFTEIFPTGTYEDVAALVHPDGVGHEAPPGSPTGPDGVWRTIQFLRSAFEGLSYEIHHAVAEGDLVALHCTLHGRQVGPLPGLPPSGAVVALRMMRLLRFADDKIIEDWGIRDELDLQCQLQAAVAPA
ncbi:ester cyclase [Microlunatus speluncae]|uniref:ester cyclase n=1 Tax=Microlunatus speluncae TaxID=2594267 RepID=UPI00126614AC|nr:ester cyclase [Microlunatus speluncae]